MKAAGRTKVIFDTSGLNNLNKDPDQETVLKKLDGAFTVLITETSVVEVSATRNAGNRKQLVDLCERLVSFGGCLMPHDWILDEMPKLHARYKNRFRWEDVDISAPMIRREIREREFLGQDEMADESWEFARTQNKKFINIFQEARDKFEPDFPNDKSLTLADVITITKAAGGPFWTIVGRWYERSRLIRLDEPEAREFIKGCPPFHAIAMGVVVAHYQYGIPKGVQKAQYKAGRNDLFMAVYLPYCDCFVTDDEGQQNALRAIAKEVGVGARILSYAEFRGELIGTGSKSATV